ncbi:MAG: TPM domain-containing protein [Gluconacetobacter diazotrophicus]|nr:TPM domain-containing protein [Gluconacetobacter diazotrophicus]
MNTKQFVGTLDPAQIAAAISAAERRTSGQIRVFVTHRSVDDDVLARARARFAKLGMEKTAARNGVLVYLAPESRKFAVVGDQGIHERCGGDEFWQRIVGETMRPRLREGRFTEAIVAAVGEVGAVLAEHFPPLPGGAGANELPDEVAED